MGRRRGAQQPRRRARGAGQSSERRVLHTESDSDARHLERLLDPIFIPVLLYLATQLIMKRFLELLLDLPALPLFLCLAICFHPLLLRT